MRYTISLLILLLTIFFSAIGNAQDIQIKSRFEKIKVQNDSSFINEIEIQFHKSNESRVHPIFYDTELEQVSDIKMFIKKGKRLKEYPIKKIFEDDIDVDYMTSKKIKSVIIPPDLEVTLKYSVSCNELMYFARLPFFSYNEIDTLRYQINIPHKFKLAYNTTHKDLLSFYSIDSSSTNTNTSWNIKVTPKKVEPDPLQFFGIYKNMKVPLMQTLVYPNSYNNQSTKYMNDWYLKSITPTKGLNVSAKSKIDELTANTDDQKEIINIIYNYVKENFKYVAIEIGMGAFIPSHVNEVFFNKQGDCKDLSNFLSEALNYKNIKSDVALAATFDHISDCNFPSLSSANHVICIAYLDGERILLDPTDPIHVEGTPVQSLQDRTIFIINPEGGSFYNVKRHSPEQNEINYLLNLKVNTSNMLIDGDFNIDYHGISSNFLNRQLKYGSKAEFKDFSKSLYEDIFGNQSISELNISNRYNHLNVTGNISINGKTFNDGSNKYIFIDFLPRLFETESRENLIEGTYLRNSFHKKVKVKIKLDESFKPFKPINHSLKEEKASLKVTIKALSNTEIECDYSFIFDYIFIDKNNIDITNKILESFKKTINEPIVLKNQNN